MENFSWKNSLKDRSFNDSIDFSLKLRKLCLGLVYNARASHIGSALSVADILSIFYSSNDILSILSPDARDRDRFILSKGHACVALYSALYLKGFFAFDELFTYGQDYSPFMNHASHIVPGVEFSTGALGHGLGVGCGKALSAKISSQNWHTFVLLSDGELQEGSNWESFMFASHNNLSNLTVVIDHNNLQSLTTVEQTLSIEPLAGKLTSFGWDVVNIDGHDHESVYLALNSSKSSLKPTVIIAKTVKGKGVSFMENKVSWHYKNPNDEQLLAAFRELG